MVTDQDNIEYMTKRQGHEADISLSAGLDWTRNPDHGFAPLRMYTLILILIIFYLMIFAAILTASRN